MTHPACDMTSEMQSPVALILCGGGSRGALEVGFYRALRELGLPLDFIIGSSIGALNGAFIAGGMPPDDLAALWRGFRREHGIRWNLRWLLGPRRRPGLFALDPLRDLLRRTLPATRFENLAVPFSIVTTDLQSGKAEQSLAYFNQNPLPYRAPTIGECTPNRTRAMQT